MQRRGSKKVKRQKERIQKPEAAREELNSEFN